MTLRFFSLGCVLYRLCTGRMPFMGRTRCQCCWRLPAEPGARKLSRRARGVHNREQAYPRSRDRPASAKDVVQAIQTSSAVDRRQDGLLRPFQGVALVNRGSGTVAFKNRTMDPARQNRRSPISAVEPGRRDHRKSERRRADSRIAARCSPCFPSFAARHARDQSRIDIS